ncbi:SNF2 family DNA or RNA helicase [Marinobacter sp. LV10R520-4]|uniref:DEAD/DEAH box helicase n=1 Tax=Marinobacter sp. LV10R520-4 TaxID=1761796 RepID=UPI000C01E388|nr:DEAD/DEAH box helicase [Marinobacter sp. LV10R520-4]PFG54132.1 SNF2 family DNA or RNA helicase [Marinobacter sp. LV10R520-4]
MTILIDQPTLLEVFGTATLQRGRRYFNEERVLYLNSSLEGASIRKLDAQVEGSGQTYQTLVTIDPHSPWALRSLCTCPVGNLCKHAVAVLLEANRRQEQEATDRPSGTNDLALTNWLNALQARSKTQAKPSNERLVYTLEESRFGNDLSVSVSKARIRKNGQFGQISLTTSWTNATLDYNRPKYIQDADVPALCWLKATPTAHRLVQALEGSIGAHFLEAAVATGRLYWTHKSDQPLSAGEPVETEFIWQQGPDDRWSLLLKEHPEEYRVVATEPPWYIDTRNHKIGRLNLPSSGGGLDLLLATPSLSSEDISRHVLHLKPVLEQFNIGLPEGIREPRSIQADPTPILQLYSLPRPDGLPPQMAAKLLFSYDGVILGLGETMAVVQLEQDGETLLVERNPRREFEHRNRIVGLVPLAQMAEGLMTLPPAIRNDLTFPAHGDWLDFLAWTLPALETEGWVIEMDESFQVPVVEADEWYGASSAAGEDGWFDLELGIMQDGHQINLIPLLMQCLELLRPDFGTDSTGELQLPENLWLHDEETLIRVPSERVRPMLETLFELYRDKDPSEPFRLPRIEAARLIGQSEADWRGGEQLQDLGRKLADFNGLDTVPAPEGLQADLRHYQQEGLNWLQFLRDAGLGGVLADDMGLGKTLQTLAHLQVEKQAGRLIKPAIVICPTSVIPNWKAEAAKFTPGLMVTVLYGPKRKKQFQELDTTDLIITSYPLLARDGEMHEKTAYSTAVFDEAQNLKNPRAAVSKAARALKAEHKIALTGTPMENHLGELWSLFDLVLPGYLGDHQEFREFFRNPIEKDGNPERHTALCRRIRPFLLRRTKEQVTPELPEKTEMVRMIELNRGQRDLYETIRASMDKKIRDLMADKGIARSQIEILEALLKLRQICCHPALLKRQASDSELASAKLDLLLDMVTELLEEGRKIIIFSQFTSMLGIIEKAFQERGLIYAKLTGQTKNRAAPVEQFQSGAAPLFLISLKAGGVGLNLVAADCVIHYDPWWNPAVERQATDRAWRIGQDKPVFVYRLICEGTVEERIQTLQERKARLADSLYGTTETFSAALTADDVKALFQPLK